MNELFDFQEIGIQKTAEKLQIYDSVLDVSPGGSGKGVIIATIAYRFISKSSKNVTIFVHKDELAHQVRKHLRNWYSTDSELINSDTIEINPFARIYVCMVETFDRRSGIQAFIDNFHDTGLLMIDEAHVGNFKKIFKFFPKPCKHLGFTATPIASDKETPLKNYFQDIVTIATQKELIALNKQHPDMGVVPSICYSFGNVDRSKFRIVGKDFDEDEVAKEFSKPIQTINTLENYLRLSFGKKTAVHNSNVAHSEIMNKLFRDNGLNSKHLDGKQYPKGFAKGYKGYRKYIFEWFEAEDDAILNNVGVFGIGTDIPSALTSIFNYSTLSLSKWIQANVRCARPFQFKDGTWKDHYLLLDMGYNAHPMKGNLGDCNDEPPMGWEFIFHNPKVPISSNRGVASIKMCPQCKAFNTITSSVCKGLKESWFVKGEMEDCGYEFPIKIKEEDTVPKELVRLSKDFDVRATIEFFRNYKEYRSMHETITQLINLARKNISSDYLDAIQLSFIIENVIEKVSEWHKIMGKHKFPDFRNSLKNKTIQELQSRGFIINIEEYQMVGETSIPS